MHVDPAFGEVLTRAWTALAAIETQHDEHKERRPHDNNGQQDNKRRDAGS